MAETPKDIADQLLEGKTIPRGLSASELDDVVFLISRRLEGDEGYQLLLSPKVRTLAELRMTQNCVVRLQPMFLTLLCSVFSRCYPC